MRFLSVLLLLSACSGMPLSTGEADFLTVAADAGCTVTSPCEFAANQDLTAIRLHASMRPNGVDGWTMRTVSSNVGSDSLLFERGIALGCTDDVPCEITMMQGSPAPTVLILINQFDRENEGTILRLSNNRLTIAN